MTGAETNTLGIPDKEMVGSVASLFHFVDVNPVTPKFKELSDGEELPFMPLENIWAYGKADQSAKKVWKKSDTSYTQFQNGDILVPKVTPTVFHGRSMITDIDSEVGLATSEVHVLRCKDQVEPRWVLYNLLSGKFLDEARGAVYGVGGLQRISTQYLQSYKVVHASVETQRRIADYLDAETAQIDTLVAELDEYVELLEKRKRSVVTYAVTRGVPGDVLLGDTASLFHFAEVNPLTLQFKKLTDGSEVPFMPLENVWAYGKADQSAKKVWKKSDTSYTQFQNGDILVPKVTPTVFHGRSMITDIDTEVGLATSEVHVLRCKEGVEPRWVLYNLLSGKFLDEARGAVYGVGGLQRISTQYLQSYKLTFASFNTQRRIADYLDKEIAKTDSIITQCRELKELLLKRRQVLITDVVTGKVEV